MQNDSIRTCLCLFPQDLMLWLAREYDEEVTSKVGIHPKTFPWQGKALSKENSKLLFFFFPLWSQQQSVQASL